jgi:hypothetical protein
MRRSPRASGPASLRGRFLCRERHLCADPGPSTSNTGSANDPTHLNDKTISGGPGRRYTFLFRHLQLHGWLFELGGGLVQNQKSVVL